MPFQFNINTGLPTPIYKQIVDRIRLAIANRELNPGDPLPSVRSTAQQLVINPNTVAKAFAELSNQGVIESQKGRGLFVKQHQQILTKTERNRRLNSALDNLISETLTLDFTHDDIRNALNKRLNQNHSPSKSGGKS